LDIITDFLKRYKKEYDFYEQACRIVAKTLDAQLQANGIRAIVTARAKKPVRLEAKMRQRNMHAKYKTTSDIYEDIVDLAGVRVALYFPGERDEVGKIISKNFSIIQPPKNFPTASHATYKKRFSGYWATHYRVNLIESILMDSQKQYADAKVEIQVASLLMHAWAEIEHDLVYKPMQGKLSKEEYAILDELNGLILTGEIALERLQHAGENRAATYGVKFANHYDLAASLLELSRGNLRVTANGDDAIGRVDILFTLLKKINLDTADKISEYFKLLHNSLEKRSLVEQIIDLILIEDPSRYYVYMQVKSDNFYFLEQEKPSHRSKIEETRAKFIQYWLDFEKKVRDKANEEGRKCLHITPELVSKIYSKTPKETILKIMEIQQIRNKLIHSDETIPTLSVKKAVIEIEKINKYLSNYNEK
jgi:ppGpp synthetase/RelA/SpoT-type nucleotidyltranferase